jgi:hypothetical protein
MTTSTIKSIAVFVDFDIDAKTGREYIEHASIQIRNRDFEMIDHVGLSMVVNTEAKLWDQVWLTVQNTIEKGYEADEPEVMVYRTHRTRLSVDYYQAIGQHI